MAFFSARKAIKEQEKILRQYGSFGNKKIYWSFETRCLPIGQANFEEMSAAGDGVDRVNIQTSNLKLL